MFCYHAIGQISKTHYHKSIRRCREKTIHNGRIFQNIIGACHTVISKVINYCIKKVINTKKSCKFDTKYTVFLKAKITLSLMDKESIQRLSRGDCIEKLKEIGQHGPGALKGR